MLNNIKNYLVSEKYMWEITQYNGPIFQEIEDETGAVISTSEFVGYDLPLWAFILLNAPKAYYWQLIGIIACRKEHDYEEVWADVESGGFCIECKRCGHTISGNW